MAKLIIDLNKYPIFSKTSPEYKQLIDRCRIELRSTGLCVLEGFVSPEALIKMRQEAVESEALAYYSTVRGNAYLRPSDPNQPKSHPFNIEDETTLGVVAYDQIPQEDVIRKIYDSSEFLSFLGEALGREEIHYYDCPMGKINYSTMRNGDYLRWHFDQSDFVVSIPVQECEKGGSYEYVYNLRSKENENFDEVKSVLEGDRTKVKVLKTPPGSLVLFEGRYTLHRVTPIEGKKIRIMALLGYADRPGVTSTDYLRQIRYGRTK